MSLVELVDNTRTDKNTLHSYLPLYQNILFKIKYSTSNILEIGTCMCGTLKLWYDYFPFALIQSVDILDVVSEYNIDESIYKNNRIILHKKTDAYEPSFYENTIGNTKFDFIIDDGPHTLESMIICVEKFTPLLSDIGIMIIEDIQDINWVKDITDKIPTHLKPYTMAIDLRHVKNRYDDIVIIIDKNMKI